jgi:hypothetical protein
VAGGAFKIVFANRPIEEDLGRVERVEMFARGLNKFVEAAVDVRG